MINIASKLSEGHPEMRVDFYEVGGKIYVGELTMTAAAGRMTSLNRKCLQMLGKECAAAYKQLNKTRDRLSTRPSMS